MPQNNRHISKEILIAVLLFGIAVFLVGESRWTRLYQDPALDTDELVDLYLDDEHSPEKLEEILTEKGLIEDIQEFNWAINTLRWRRFQAGHYRIEEGTSYNELFSRMGRGLQDPIQFTLLPGRPPWDVKKRIYQSFRFDSLALSQTLSDSTFLAEHGIDTTEVIGHLYPDSYSFYWTASSEQVVERIFKTFNQKVTEQYRERLDELDITMNEAIILASIIEWEASQNDEKKTISGLYWNRLNRGMRLQADPTVNYAVGERRRLLYEDYKVEHPYNTYLHEGLPPGPITNPSQSSIEAALFPEEHDYLYMVAAPEGNHNFSETFEEHKRKSAEWRQWLNEQYRLKEERERNNNNRSE
ncbi:endolytic transglycosylase MltG [Aliifodinibius salicampi]|uniref:Endolytic murein transglycosylase n=1 Tax=Fodinibius salicampi TaxID=1920655 RepID=A0ABT3PVV8_9BACT|nr:endolytic transglycosylase MltG [Fodinibius salicampi]MCW9711966.1 endolytic transglycosylase MltG [Fodinibius salicampi]